MIALVLGTPNSGKSRRAEALALRLAGAGRRVYLATMIPYGAAGRERVERHLNAREGKGFETIERTRDLRGLLDERDLSDAVCLLECAANLVGNEMHAPENQTLSDAALVEAIVGSIAALGARTKALVVVSNEFPADAPGYDDDTRRYVALLGGVNARLRELASSIDELSEGEWRTLCR